MQRHLGTGVSRVACRKSGERRESGFCPASHSRPWLAGYGWNEADKEGGRCSSTVGLLVMGTGVTVQYSGARVISRTKGPHTIHPTYGTSEKALV